MSSDPYISDETLTAYLDDELSQEDRAMVERALMQQPELADRLAALDVPMDALRDGAEALLNLAGPVPEFPEPRRAPVWPWMGGLAAASVAGFLIGAVWHAGDEPTWVDAVANYQSLYVSETLSRSEPLERREAALVALSDVLGLDLSPLKDIEGIEYRRAQMLGYEGKPLVQVAYLDGGVPIAICITPRGGGDSAVEQDAYFGMAAASWQEDGHGFLVIGGQDEDLVRRIAGQVRERL